MGVDKEVMLPGDGLLFPKKGNRVKVHYTAFLSDGTEVDSSRKKGKIYEFGLGNGEVIKGTCKGTRACGAGVQRTRCVRVVCARCVVRLGARR